MKAKPEPSEKAKELMKTYAVRSQKLANKSGAAFKQIADHFQKKIPLEKDREVNKNLSLLKNETKEAYQRLMAVQESLKKSYESLLLKKKNFS